VQGGARPRPGDFLGFVEGEEAGLVPKLRVASWLLLRIFTHSFPFLRGSYFHSLLQPQGVKSKYVTKAHWLE
jgi:hypothetical protein